MKILVVSPHRDDAAFSLSASIGHWLTVGHQVTVLNIFTRSLYAPYANTEGVAEKDLLDHISTLRSKEDRKALEKLGVHEVVDLDVEDAPIRLKCDSSIVCDMQVDPQDKAIPQIQKALKKLLADRSQELALVLPLGLGHHVDHRTARDAALTFTPELPCAFYEELPYATRDGVRVDLSRFREDAATRLHEPLFPVLCHGTHTRPADWKRTVALMYQSQIDHELADVIAGFSHRYHGAERLWANEVWLTSATREKLSARQRDVEAEPLPA